MTIRKFVMTVTVAVMTLATATCFAQITVDDLVINGIYVGQPVTEVINRLGEPAQKTTFPGGGSMTQYSYNFGSSDSFSFTTSSDGQNVVAASVSNGCNFVTKAGIGIGSSFADIKAAYGEPDKAADFRGKTGIISTTYFYDTSYGGNTYSMTFVVMKSSGGVSTFSFAQRQNAGSSGSRPQTPVQQKPTKPKSTIPDYITQIPASELNLGWIEPGQPMNKVEQVYGKPGIIDDQGFFRIYSYNDKFIVKGKMNNGYKVTSVASYEKGMKTPSGFMVGDAYSAVVKKFGAVNGVKFKGEELEAKMKNLKGCTDYTHFSGQKQMVFLVDKKGIIQAIRVEDYDEQKFIEARRKK